LPIDGLRCGVSRKTSGKSRPENLEEWIMNHDIRTEAQIEASPVTGESERLSVLPKHFGRYMLSVENAFYHFMRKFARDYGGGFWRYYELSNGGFYMTPDHNGDYEFRIDSNGYEGRMSADAAGITVCLFALSHLSFQVRNDALIEHFHALRAFAMQHAEASAIFAAID
jgi:hypothetical protein